MRGCLLGLMLVAWMAVCIQPLQAQVVMERTLAEGEEVHILQELGVVLKSADKAIEVELVLPEDIRPKGYEHIEVRQGDQILAINKKRVKSMQEFLEVYQGIGSNEEVKLGIQRGQQLMLVAFDKLDPDQLPQGRRVMVATSGGPEGAGDKKVAGGMFVMKGGSGDVRPLMGTGLLLGGSDGEVEVVKVLHRVAGVDVREGDVVVSLNGATGLEQVFQRYEGLAAGDRVQLVLRRGDDKVEAAFPKPEAQGKMVIRDR